MRTEDLLEKGLTQEQVNFVMQENGKDLKKLQKEVDTLTTERDNFKERAETAEKTLEGLDGKSLEDIKKERDDWKKKAEDAEKNFNAKEAEREKQELLKEAFADVEFTSNAAKNAIMAQIGENVSVKNGKLIGFNDLLEDAKKNDASAFVTKEGTQRITSGTVNNNNSGSGILTEKEIGAIKDTRERQKAWAEKIAHDNSINKN